MALGPGKYDRVCELAAKLTGVTAATGGGVLLIVIGGDQGNGFSTHVDLETGKKVPEMLRFVAEQIENDIKGLT